MLSRGFQKDLFGGEKKDVFNLIQALIGKTYDIE